MFSQAGTNYLTYTKQCILTVKKVLDVLSHSGSVHSRSAVDMQLSASGSSTVYALTCHSTDLFYLYDTINVECCKFMCILYRQSECHKVHFQRSNPSLQFKPA